MPLSIEKPVESLSLSEKAYDILKEQIVQGNLKPGERLSVYELAKRLQISRTPIKEAIHRLSLQGLITIQSRKSTFVSTLEPRKVEELFDVRLMMELWAAEHAIQQGSSLDLKRMAYLLKQGGSVFSSGEEFDYATFTSFDQQFHLLIVDGAQNLQLRMAYDSLNAHFQIMRVYWGRARDRAFKSHKEHLKVFEAFQQKSLPRIRSALTAHITQTRDDILRRLPSLIHLGRKLQIVGLTHEVQEQHSLKEKMPKMKG
jgi:DNA-binding GntR family transcriptional regulator